MNRLATLTTIGSISAQLRGVTYEKADARSEPGPGLIPLLRANNIVEDQLSLADLIFVPRTKVNNIQLLRRHDVLVTASSGSLSSVGKAAAVKSQVSATFGAFCKVLRPDTSQVDAQYFSHFFRTTDYRRSISALAAGININNLRNEHLNSLVLPLPPLQEQRRIAAILDKADALRQKRKRAIALLGYLIDALVDQAFRDLAPSALISELFDVQGGLQLSGSRAKLATKVPYLRVANIYRDRLDVENVKVIGMTASELRRTSLLAGDVLFVEGHGNPAEIGRCAVWDGSISLCSHQNHLIRARPRSRDIDPYVISRWLNTENGRRHLLRRGKTTSGLNTISVSDVKAAPIPVMSPEASDRLRRGLDSISRQKEEAVASISTLEALFSSLQHRAFSGQL